MKQKLFTLMTLLVLCVTGAWATPVTIFDANASDWASATLTSGTTTVGDVTWYGQSSASIGSDSHSFADEVSWTKYLKTGGASTFQSGQTNKAVLTYTPTLAGKMKVYAKGGGNSERYVYITQSAATSTKNDPSIALGSAKLGDGTNALYDIAEADVEAGKVVSIYVTTGNVYIYGITFEEDTRLASDIAISKGKSSIFLTTTGNYTLAKDVDYTTSSTGAYTYKSGNDAIATVDSDGKITAVAAGTTTITLTQAGDVTYRKGTLTFTVNINAPLAWSASNPKPTGVLDLSNATTASTMLNKAWNDDKPYYCNDGSSNYILFTAFSAYGSKANQTWIASSNQGSSGQTWEAKGVFKGNAAYSGNSSHDSRSANVSNSKLYSYRITGVSEIQALAKSSNSSGRTITMAAFEMTGETPAENTMLHTMSGAGSNVILSLPLDKAKEYIIFFKASDSNNASLYEVALFYDSSVTLTESVTLPTSGYSTIASRAHLNLASLPSGLAAYKISATSASSATLETVTEAVEAGTPLILVGTGGASYSIPMAATGNTISSNKLHAALVSTEVAADYAYIMNGGKFHPANAGWIPAGKAYLLQSEVGSAHEFTLEFGNGTTGIQQVEDNASKATGFFNLAGQRVAQPTKGLYIVNGRKVIIK